MMTFQRLNHVALNEIYLVASTVYLHNNNNNNNNNSQESADVEDHQNKRRNEGDTHRTPY